VAAPELDAVALEETKLLLGEDARALLGGLLQAEQALQAGLEVVASPDAADAGDADVYAVEPEFVGHTLGAMRGMLERVGEDLGFDLVGHAVRMGAPGAAPLFDQGGHPADLEGRRTSEKVSRW